MANITGTNAGDTLTGTNSADQIRGLGGADSMSGRDGDDILEGGAGGDLLDGANGFDMASYHGSGVGVYVDLKLGYGALGDAEGDGLYQIEGAIGSAQGDFLGGTDGHNVLRGEGGIDTLV